MDKCLCVFNFLFVCVCVFQFVPLTTFSTQPAKRPVNNIFKASALWADAYYKSTCPYVCLSVCVFVCVFIFELPFKRSFAPTSRSRMSIVFSNLESLGKVMKRSGIR